MLTQIENALEFVGLNFIRCSLFQEEFREYPPLLKQSVSLARYCLEPLVEVSRLFNADNDVLFINLHSIQSEIPKDDLFIALLHECINRVNEVSLDV